MVQRPRFIQWRWIMVASGLLLMTAHWITPRLDSPISGTNWLWLLVPSDGPLLAGCILFVFGLMAVVTSPK